MIKNKLILLKISIINIFDILGIIVKYLTLVIDKKYVVFYSQRINAPNVNHLYFQNFVKNFYTKKNKSIKFLYLDKPNNLIETLLLIKYLIGANLFIYNIPSDLFINRKIFAKSATKILIHRGIAIKSGGVFARHLSKNRKKLYLKLCNDVDYFFVNSQLEKYITISSLNIDYQKVKIIENKNVYIDRKLAVSQVNELKNKFNYIVTYFPTHRDHLNNCSPNLFDILNSEIIKLLREKNILLLYNFHALDNSTFLNLEEDYIKPINEVITNPNDSLDLVDSLITDYSGIYLKILSELKVSLAFVFNDLNNYKYERGIILPKDVLFPGEHIHNSDDLKLYFENIDKYDLNKFSQRRKSLQALFFESDINENFDKILNRKF